MKFSVLQVISFLILLAGTTCIITAIATDYWEYRFISDMKGLGKLEAHRGLIKSCHECVFVCGLFETKTCHYRFASMKVEKNTYNVSYKTLQAWEAAVLGLMCLSGFLGIISLVSSFFCCNRCPLCLTFLVLFAALCATVGLGVYAWKCGTGESNTIRLERPDSTHEIGWSFWVGVGGAALKLLSTVAFGCISRTKRTSNVI